MGDFLGSHVFFFFPGCMAIARLDQDRIVNRSFVQLLKSNTAMFRPLVSISMRKDRVFEVFWLAIDASFFVTVFIMASQPTPPNVPPLRNNAL